MKSKSINNLIDRDALKREVRDVVFTVADTPLSNDPASKLIFKMGELLAKKIDDAPGVDAVEVVRCKDCLNCGMKASIKYDGYRDDVRLCMLHGIAVLPDDYCSGGVKMDAEVSNDA